LKILLSRELARRYQCCVKQMIWQLFMSKRGDKFLIKVSHKNQRNPFFCPHQKIYAGFIIIVWAFSKQTMICKFKLEWKVPRSGLKKLGIFYVIIMCWLTKKRRWKQQTPFKWYFSRLSIVKLCIVIFSFRSKLSVLFVRLWSLARLALGLKKHDD